MTTAGRSPSKITAMATTQVRPGLNSKQRSDAVADVLGSVRAEGLDTSSVEPDVQTWVRGEITTHQLVQRQLDAVASEHGQPRSSAHAA